jgi:hypothetical protein
MGEAFLLGVGDVVAKDMRVAARYLLVDLGCDPIQSKIRLLLLKQPGRVSPEI